MGGATGRLSGLTPVKLTGSLTTGAPSLMAFRWPTSVTGWWMNWAGSARTGTGRVWIGGIGVAEGCFNDPVRSEQQFCNAIERALVSHRRSRVLLARRYVRVPRSSR